MFEKLLAKLQMQKPAPQWNWPAETREPTDAVAEMYKRMHATACAERDAAIARAEAAEARFRMKDRPRDAKGHFLPTS